MTETTIGTDERVREETHSYTVKKGAVIKVYKVDRGMDRFQPDGYRISIDLLGDGYLPKGYTNLFIEKEYAQYICETILKDLNGNEDPAVTYAKAVMKSIGGK